MAAKTLKNTRHWFEGFSVSSEETTPRHWSSSRETKAKSPDWPTHGKDYYWLKNRDWREKEWKRYYR